MTTPAAPTVPIGPTTIVGYGGTVVGLIASILVLIFPDGDEQTIALIASAVFTLGSFLVTQIGRYLQAKEMAKPPQLVASIEREPGALNTVFTPPPSRAAVAQHTAAWDPNRPPDPAVDLVGDKDLPTDEEEAAIPPPDNDSAKTTPLDPDVV